MFTGIIQSKGRVVNVKHSGTDMQLSFALGSINAAKVALGDSIAVNGVCLTAIAINKDDNTVRVDVSKETLDVTLLNNFVVDSVVNLELALCAGDHLGGHIVSGHVDGVATLKDQYAEGDSTRLVFTLNERNKSLNLGQFIAEKGSVTIDGVSLTVNHVTDTCVANNGGENATEFGINIVPHTRENTIIGNYQVGAEVHIEIDMLARYMQRQKAFANSFKTY